MPQKIKTRRLARKFRKTVNAGKNRQVIGCEGSDRKKKTAPKVIGASIHSLTVRKKPGIEIVNKVEGKRYRGDDDYFTMYEDLLACYKRACKITGEPGTFDPMASGLEIGASLYSLTGIFKGKFVPENWKCNIDRSNDAEYYFTIYKTLDFNEWWHAFPIKPIIYKVRNNKPLLAIFLQYIKALMDHSGIMGWWNGGMGYADWQLEEKIENWEYEYDNSFKSHRELEKAKATLERYRNGEAKHYQDLIIKAKCITPAALAKKLKGLHKNKLIELMLAGCELMQRPGLVANFIYGEFEDEVGEGLRFDQQVAVIWDWDDEYTNMQEECLDAEAQGCGILPPILNFHITKHLKAFDPEDLEKRSEWPSALTELFYKHRDYCDSLKGKRNAKQPNNRINVNV